MRYVVFVALVFAASACVSPEAYRDLEEANRDLTAQLADLRGHQADLEAENRRLSGEVDKLGRSAVQEAEYNKRKAELERLIAEFQQGGARNVPGVTVHQTSEGLVFRMQGEVLFNSGKAEVTKTGADTLSQLLSTLRDHAARGKTIRIDGHTDSDPIKHSPWKTNLRLSAERAMAVRDYLYEKGMQPERMFIAAFGAQRPAVAGSDGAAKRANRRVEILLAE